MYEMITYTNNLTQHVKYYQRERERERERRGGQGREPHTVKKYCWFNLKK